MPSSAYRSYLIFGTYFGILAIAFHFNTDPIVTAQVIPDNSLGRENSVVTPNTTIKNTISDLIEGGAVRGNNLFHSFAEFNVTENSGVYFANPDGITNILTRITGNNISEIFGTLGVDGTANLFLLNPQGIIFGENSALDINGSFLATTADSYVFNNDFTYSARDPEVPPLLTVNIPLGLQFGAEAAPIINQSRFANNDGVIRGLTIPANQSLSLIGGDVVLKGGYLSTSAGNIEIGAVGSESKVDLVSTANRLQADYQEVTTFADIKINQFGGINGGEIGGSTITLTGNNINLGQDLEAVADVGYRVEDFFSLEPLPNLEQLPDDSVQITAHNLDNATPSQIRIDAKNTFSLINSGNINANTEGNGDAGKIDFQANSLVIYGGGLSAESNRENITGNSGTINFEAQNMSVQNSGAGVSTYSSGDGGTIDLNIARDLKIQSGGFGAETFSQNNGGDGGIIAINAENLEVVSGGAGVNTFGSGDAGTIDLNLANNLTIKFGGFGSDTGGTGNGGRIEIDAKHIDINSGGIGVHARNLGSGGQLEIRAKTITITNGGIGSESGTAGDVDDFDSNRLQQRFGRTNAGDGGSISLEADSLKLEDSDITTKTFGTGNAGNIKLDVHLLEMKGAIDRESNTVITTSTEASGNGGKIEILASDIILIGNAAITAQSLDIGNAGNIKIKTDRSIQLRDESSISVDGGIEGRSGNLTITSDRINLKDNSSISAEVNNGSEGNIVLIADSLKLSDRSTMTTNARGNAIGGNISIDLRETLIAENSSQIVANAVDGRGGNIEITARGIFAFSDTTIDASSEFGTDGTIQLNNLSIDLNSSLVSLPQNLMDSSTHLARGCQYKDNNRFVYIGRGALPEQIVNPQVNEGFLVDFDFDAIEEFQLSPVKSIPRNLIIEAQAWQVNQKGNIELIAFNKSHLALSDRNLDCGGKASN